MIRDFWVENYLSIRERQGIDFVAKSGNEFLNVEIAPGVFLNKLGILYGANASGKSNMLFAIQNIFSILYESRNDINEEVSSAPPFELTKEQPIKMHVSFYADSIRYDYDVEYYKDHIEKEVLNYYPNGSKALFYERMYKGNGFQADIKFGDSLKLKARTQDTLRDNTLNNHSVLSTYRKVSMKEDVQPLASLFRWIEQHVHEVDGDERTNIIEELKDVCKDSKRRKFYQLMLRKADLNITDFRPISISKKISDEMRKRILEIPSLSETAKREILESPEEDILFLNSSKEGVFEISRHLQSMGTIQYITIDIEIA